MKPKCLQNTVQKRHDQQETKTDSAGLFLLQSTPILERLPYLHGVRAGATAALPSCHLIRDLFHSAERLSGQPFPQAAPGKLAGQWAKNCWPAFFTARPSRIPCRVSAKAPAIPLGTGLMSGSCRGCRGCRCSIQDRARPRPAYKSLPTIIHRH